MVKLHRNDPKFRLAAGLIVVAIAGLVCSTPDSGVDTEEDVAQQNAEQKEFAEYYACEEHPEVRGPEPADCPVCQREMVGADELSKQRDREPHVPDEIPEGGMGFDPPVQIEELPQEQEYWYCDLGTVEWAQPEPDEDGCPICGINLVHYEPADDVNDVDDTDAE